MGVNFNVTMQESRLIESIVDRASSVNFSPLNMTRQSMQMDLCATIAQGIKLDLQCLLVADDFSFIHDMLGIAMHMDRQTGHLRNNFVPRFVEKLQL
jgi:hypothetical protein